METKDIFINEFISKLPFDSNVLKIIKDQLIIDLYDYDLKRVNSSDIVVYDDNFNSKCFQSFMIAKKVSGRSLRTLKYYSNEISRFFVFFNNKPINEITSNDIRYYLAKVQQTNNCSEVNLNNIRRVLSSLFGFLYIEEIIKTNPISKVSKIKEEEKVKKALTEMEVEKLRNVLSHEKRIVKKLRNTAILEVLLSTGCRVSELINMDKTNYIEDEIKVLGKGNKERIVYLNTKAKFALTQYLNYRKDDSELLFVTLNKPYQKIKFTCVEILLRELGKVAGVENVHPHRFRRTAATWALRRGMPIDQVKDLLGHTSIDTTNIYIEKSSEDLKFMHKKYLA